MSNGRSSSGGGIGLAGCVFIVFLVLKLAEIGPIKDWSWWWVTSPLWIGLVLVFGILAMVLGCGGLIVGIGAGLMALFGRKKIRREW